MEMGASPMPNSDTSTNWPGLWPRSLPPGSLTSKKVSVSVIFWTRTTSAVSGT